ncbi:ATP-binding protein [Pedobacter sp. L105]|uniref:sensor histidine kinase n=1 Tax=Pedobacter sp. L105 TaxID=1641871 RepID=UPI00131B3340|nr:ATP-binding protein [Pedobacter sp. L105]
MNRRPKILYLRNPPHDAEHLLEILEELTPTYEYLAVQTMEDYINCLQEFRPDIIMADEDINTFNTREALDVIGHQEKDIPFILISSASREDYALEFLKAGAVDYVLKEKPQRLLFVLFNQVARLRAISDMEQALREKERLYKRNLADTTALKISEKQMMKSKANLRTLFDHTDTAYFMVNDDFKVISYNLPALRMTEEFSQPTLAVGSHILDFFPAQRKPEIINIIQRVMDGESVSYHSTFPDHKGDDRWYSIKWIGVGNDQRKHWGFILSVRDITKSKTIEMTLAETNIELTKRNKSLEQFTYIVSHNLLAPVANIVSLTELLKDVTASEHEELVEGLQTSIKTMHTIIKDLNQTLQVKDAVHKKKEEVHFRQLVEEITFSINNLMISEEVSLHCDFEAKQSLFTVRGYLYSIFYNLMLNSIKYRRPEEAPIISIKSMVNMDQIFLTFEDNCKGIDMEKNGAQLFGLYKRFDTSIEGRGMGMFMVKTQIEELNGSIEVESQLGKGTKITIRFPLPPNQA